MIRRFVVRSLAAVLGQYTDGLISVCVCVGVIVRKVTDPDEQGELCKAVSATSLLINFESSLEKHYINAVHLFAIC